MLKKAKPRHIPRTRVVLDRTAASADVLAELARVGGVAKYESSPYHKTGKNAVGRKHPPANKCNPLLTLAQADSLLKEAIKAGNVSQAGRNHFPSFVWCLVDGVLYEARLSNETLGHYHAYPLEDQREWPENLKI